ncbi:MAG: hypothetical protein H0T51_21275 [Pirellulales bacterium]|nr:hypothetical protein [Pirellulales bacterium]
MQSRTEAIAAFLQASTHRDLADRFASGLEVQVTVAQDNGEPACDRETGKPRRNTYIDPDVSGGEPWFNYRIPQNANNEPKSNDGPQRFSLSEHAEAVGITGWDWQRSRSVAVGFDFDGIVNHAEGVGISHDELERVKQAACELPYVEVRKSTSGTGLHLWVVFDENDLPETANHLEHAALARAVLSQMSFECHFDFAAAVDCAGMVLWIWHRKMTAENEGLKLIKAARTPLTEYPRDWRDHLSVVARKGRRTRVKGPANDADATAIARYASDRAPVQLDAKHHEFMDCYKATGFEGYWQQDHRLFTAHTCGVAKVVSDMKMLGVFETQSQGSDPRTPNCFLFPLANGARRVFRYGTGGGQAQEADTWEESPSGWTTCTINVTPTLEQVAKAYAGVRRPTPRGVAYIFRDSSAARKAVAAFGGDLAPPSWITEAPTPRPVTITFHSGGGLLVSMPHNTEDEVDGRAAGFYELGWMKERGPVWAQLFEVETTPKSANYEDLADDIVRHVAQAGEQEGLYVNTERGWQKQTVDQVKAHLTHKGVKGAMQADVLGWCSNNPYELVSKPFQPEYPGHRGWNRNAAQLKTVPSPAAGPTPTWDAILSHTGAGLDDAVSGDPWCQENGIATGGEYLTFWVANLIRFPERRLPLLAMFSPEQGTGKSTLHEAVRELITDEGFTFGDVALREARAFNGELHGRALCVSEETNLASCKQAYDRIKAWVTNPTLPIHPKGGTPFAVVNVSHWIVCTQYITSVPIAPRDERIVLWEVRRFEGMEIPKPELMERLGKEAPYFLRKLMDLDLSDVCGRHTLPVLMTPEKVEAMHASPISAASLDGARLDLAKAVLVAFRSKNVAIELDGEWRATAEQLLDILGNWDGQAERKNQKSRATQVGTLIMQTADFLRENGVNLEREDGRVRTYILTKTEREIAA